MLTLTNNSASTVVEGGVSAVALLFLHETVMQTIPWLICVIPLLIIDGIEGVRATKYRYKKTKSEEDKFTFTKLLRKTIGKTFEYISWCILGGALAVAAKKDWIAWAVLFLPFVNELVSIWGHKLELQGVEINLTNLWRFIFRKGGEKAGVEVSKEEAEEIIQPKPRDERGRFVKRCGVILEQENLIENDNDEK